MPKPAAFSTVDPDATVLLRAFNEEKDRELEYLLRERGRLEEQIQGAREAIAFLRKDLTEQVTIWLTAEECLAWSQAQCQSMNSLRRTRTYRLALALLWPGRIARKLLHRFRA